MGNTVGIFGNVNHVETAIKQLLDAGIGADTISVVAAGISGNQTLHGVMTVQDGSVVPTVGGEGTGEGAVKAGIFKLLSGFAMIWIPGAGPTLAVGPISDALAGALTGVGQGALTMALTAQGVPEKAAEAYSGLVRGGSYVVAIATDSVETTGVVRQHLDDNGATQIDVYATL